MFLFFAVLENIWVDLFGLLQTVFFDFVRFFHPHAHLLLLLLHLCHLFQRLGLLHRFDLRLDGWFFLGAIAEILLVDVHELDEFRDGLRAFGLEILIFLHVAHLLMQLQHHCDEFLLVCGFCLVEFDDPLLEDVEEGVDAVIVGFLLETGGEAWVDGHGNIITGVSNLKLKPVDTWPSKSN